jgi:hypothetical protein
MNNETAREKKSACESRKRQGKRRKQPNASGYEKKRRRKRD